MKQAMKPGDQINSIRDSDVKAQQLACNTRRQRALGYSGLGHQSSNWPLYARFGSNVHRYLDGSDELEAH